MLEDIRGKIKIILVKIVSLLRSCANCGINYGENFGTIDLFCEKCWQWFEGKIDKENQRVVEFDNKKILLKYLFYWDDRFEKKEMFHLIKILKKGKVQLAMNRLAWFFVRKYDFLQLSKNTVLIPAPKKKGLKTDHALELAKAFRGIFQCELIELLEENSVSEQKKLSRKERAERKFTINRDNEGGAQASNRGGDRQYIFVDDVLTTGSTAKAAYEALGYPKNFMIWTVAYRGKCYN